MHDPQISNFYFANLESDPFFTILKSRQGLGAVSKKEVALDRMLMFDGHLQVLFYAPPPNSQLLFFKLENSPLF